MPKAKESSVSRRAWNLLHLALLWARRGGAFKHLQLRLLAPKFLKTIGHTATPRSSHTWHRERELSFEKTPVVHVKMHRPGSMRFMLPCINPTVDFDMEFDDEDGNRVCHGYDSTRKSFSLENGDEEECSYDDRDYGRIEREEEEREIDSRAEEFIAKFYEQIRLQRQMSYLQHNEMLNRSAS
ncbi:uncharacterized protein LOC115750178 [Rhodamnia argentea]|uniref:Uncharacterized protein LOC115750178 n=1 Tax=Rhodamnia argentea TaxID=178133 RepID=A0A8B8QAE5_9MYRT|nr:uncharacterized protein LOC115750178 [Rhodamnia argentea]